MTRRMIFLTPTFRPVGGVVKVFDYVTHARSLGFAVDVHCPETFHPGLPLFANDRFAALVDDPMTRMVPGFRFGLGDGDYCFFSWPPHFDHVGPVIGPWHDPRQAILIIQNVRWANPGFVGGRAVRVLGMPMARIAVTHQVAGAIDGLVETTMPTRVIVEGHDWPFFSRARSGGLERPVRVGYTTWKSAVGIAVEKALGNGAAYQFRSIRETAAWPEIRDLYHWCDVFLGCPGPEEGFYLPGLEAMAAGCLVVMPDVGGNRAYADFGVNCVEVPLDDAAAYVAAIRCLSDEQPWDIDKMRDAGYAVLENHRLDRERSEFGRFVAELDGDIGIGTT